MSRQRVINLWGRFLTNMVNGEHCQDCNPVHCQMVNLALQQAVPDIESSSIPIPSQFSSIYQAQHLAGYWQEILRPPKA